MTRPDFAARSPPRRVISPLRRASCRARRLAAAFAADQRAGPITEFAMTGLAFLTFIVVILNLGLLGAELGAVARGVQSAARIAVVTAAQNFVTNSAYSSCPSDATVATYFDAAAVPLLPTSGTNSTTSNPYVNAGWHNNTAPTSGSPPGIYLALSVKYIWSPVGFQNILHVPLTLATVATVPGSMNGSPTISSTCVGTIP